MQTQEIEIEAAAAAEVQSENCKVQNANCGSPAAAEHLLVSWARKAPMTVETFEAVKSELRLRMIGGVDFFVRSRAASAEENLRSIAAELDAEATAQMVLIERLHGLRKGGAR